ncbi:MAG TPA: DUF4835 family protein [Bacteroidia bacterium]|jgi:hypothetical protein|nr:DUF4835 family protein [Bacteroidia bacterium]
MSRLNKHILLLLTATCLLQTAHSQELNAQVEIVTTQVQGTDVTRIFGNMKRQVFEFLNNRRWTNDNFQQSERIDCSILINVTAKLGTDQYQAEIEVQCRRPVFKTGYNSPLFNFQDKDLQFVYVENQPFDFTVQNFTNNITSILAYYAYIMLAVDYDSFSLLGGSEYWKTAQQIVNAAQSASETGWRSSDSYRNRYWLIDNILNPLFQPMRETMYNYHRKGLDQMYDKPEEGRAAILAAIDNLKEVHKNRPASFNMQLFFEAKNQEIVNIFKEATNEEKTKLIEILNLIDPANQNIYAKINQ